MSETVDMRLDQLDLVREVLRRHLPLHTRVFAFGSRTCGRAGRFSDLDLALDAGAPLTSGTMLTLREEFEESDLPYPVDLVDWHAACHGVREFVRRASVLLLPSLDAPVPPRDGATTPGGSGVDRCETGGGRVA